MQANIQNDLRLSRKQKNPYPNNEFLHGTTVNTADKQSGQ